jgi:tRNA-uridine 2-sulfurtransferase
VAAKGRVLMAMSGGVDSSIAAILLHEQGYEVIGFTLKTWDYSSSGGSKKETGCCSLDSINDARKVAVKLGFKHYVIDVREEFNKCIVDDFVKEYTHGRTPNPCVLCNTHIKWGLLLQKADALGCDFIATGHYAQVRLENDRAVLFQGVDVTKDQSYVLWGLSQDYLKRTIFPLGGYTKQYIKQLAVDLDFKELSDKSESYEICFIPDNDYRSFLNFKVAGLAEKLDGGNFVDTTGKILGKHKGFPFYTIGQRKGLNIAVGHPLYVVNILPESNTVVLGIKEELASKNLTVSDYNLIKYAEIPENIEVLTKIRYKDSGTISTVRKSGSSLLIEFQKPVMGVAPGQSAVFYEGNDVVGGGIIT